MIKNLVFKVVGGIHKIPCFQESLKKVGCTVPFLDNQDHICQNVSNEIMKEAYHLYDEIVFHANSCIKNCKSMRLMVTERSSQNEAKTMPSKGSPRQKPTIQSSSLLSLHFDKYVKVTTSHVAYEGLELLAELGGYVGLFLGFSVFEIHKIVEYVCNILSEIFKN